MYDWQKYILSQDKPSVYPSLELLIGSVDHVASTELKNGNGLEHDILRCAKFYLEEASNKKGYRSFSLEILAAEAVKVYFDKNQGAFCKTYLDTSEKFFSKDLKEIDKITEDPEQAKKARDLIQARELAFRGCIKEYMRSNTSRNGKKMENSLKNYFSALRDVFDEKIMIKYSKHHERNEKQLEKNIITMLNKSYASAYSKEEKNYGVRGY